jgi:UDP-N-acetylglucosamine 2-epimerase (non-hydrolysing)
MVIMGTRPEIIRLYHTIETLRPEFLVWTNQNYSKNLKEEIFFDPAFPLYKDIVVGLTDIKFIADNSEISSIFSVGFSSMIQFIDKAIEKNKPKKILILGDTNTSLAGALMAKKHGIQLFHMEAGNRCYNPESPEECNRKMIDAITDIHLCYTDFSKQNLLQEGVPLNRIHVIGNPISEIDIYTKPSTHSVTSSALFDIHRAENEKYLYDILLAASKLNKSLMLLHPRYEKKVKDKVKECGWKNIEVGPSVGFTEFIKHQRSSALVITDSGTVCEEAAIVGRPCIILRETMERPELLEMGSTVLCHPKDWEGVLEAYSELVNKDTLNWEVPVWYRPQKISKKVKNILLSKGNYI